MPAEDFPKMVPEKYKRYRSGRHPCELFVSPDGSDKWTGTLSAANAWRSDGPFATIGRAREWLRANPTPGPVTVWLRAGRHELRAPLRFGPEDSGPVTFAAWPGEEAVLDGGRRIGNWQAAERDGRVLWVADLPQVRSGEWYFTQLFVNGARRDRPRWPKEGLFYMESVPDTPVKGFMAGTISNVFHCEPGHIRAWENLQDVDVVAVHYWNEERLPVVSFDPATRRVTCARKSVWPLKDDAAPRYARYWVENVKEALTAPGEWYLDRREGRLYYLPLPGEDAATADVRAPVIPQLLLVEGDEAANRPVSGLTFRGLRFEHASWQLPPGDRAGHEQAAANVPAAIALRFARHCAVEDCIVRHCGGYAVELGPGCQGNRVAGCTLADLGAGGVKCVGADADEPAVRRTSGNVVCDNEIAHGGRVFHSAVGVLLIHTSATDVVHNHIHHLEYSGISCGWVWGYGPNPTHDVLIAHNHIHDLGTGLLNDMGGIYTLGVQPGTIIRGNVIHGVRVHNYGGWAIYADEGSSHLLVERNLCYDTDSELFHVHYGRENMVRNNIFALSRLGQVSLTVTEDGHRAFTFLRNIVLTDGKPAFLATNRESLDRRGFESDLNLFWDVAGRPVFFANQHRDEQNRVVVAKRYTVEELRQHGYDRHSIVADPGFASPRDGGFGMAAGGPAAALGFEVLDLSSVGPRPWGGGRAGG